MVEQVRFALQLHLYMPAVLGGDNVQYTDSEHNHFFIKIFNVQIRGSLSSIRTLSKMLSVQTRKSEVCGSGNFHPQLFLYLSSLSFAPK